MKNAEPTRYIVRWNNSIRDLAWDRLTRDVGRVRGDRMRKIKKELKGTRERDGQNSGEEGKGDERGGKTSRDIFRKELGKPKRPVEFHTMAFRTTIKRAAYHTRKWWYISLSYLRSPFLSFPYTRPTRLIS